MEFDYSGKKYQGSIDSAGRDSHGADLDISITVDYPMLKYTCEVDPVMRDGTRLPRREEEGQLFFVGPNEEIRIKSNGGAGVPGLNGQDGYPGSPGHNGSDATQYSYGGNGGDGQRGGDGTPGTSGGPGGDGGNVTISIREQDTDALAILSVENKGGEGGPPGRHGRGGEGGRGGRGGNSYSWNEPYQEYVTKYRSVPRYENGNTVYVQESYSEYETRYRSRYHQGGSDGRPGANGHTPTTPLYRGARGIDGSISILVETEQGIRRYDGPYTLELESFHSAAFANNGIYEPGDTIEISDIRIRNSGSMPTPRGGLIEITVAPNEWSQTEPLELCLAEEIPPGESVVIPGRLLLRIREYTGEQHEALLQPESLDLQARAWRFSKQLRSFTHPEAVVLSHPVETTSVAYAGSLLPNEITRVTLGVTNTSLRALGGDNLEQALRRGLKFQFEECQTSTEASRLVFCREDGEPLADPVLEYDVGMLQPGETLDVSTYVKLGSTGTERRSHVLHGKLLLEKIGVRQEFKRIQTSDIEIKEGIPYHPDTDASFLLVINQTTTQEELRAWKESAESLQLSLAIWDLGVYPHLPMTEQYTALTNSTLAREWRGKLVVVLNSGGGPDARVAPNAFDHLSRHDLDVSMREHNVRFYLVGNPYPIAYRPTISPVPIYQSGESLKVYADLRRALKSERATHTELTLPVERTFFKSSTVTSEEYLEREVNKVRQRLARDYPNDRLYISSTSAPEPCRKVPLLPLFREHVGHITIRREEAPRDALLMGASIDYETMPSPTFVRSEMNKILVFASMPKKQLVDVLMSALTKGRQDAASVEVLCKAFTHKVAVELGAASLHEQDWGVGESPTLAHLSERFRDEMSADKKPILSLCALITSRVMHLHNLARPWHVRLLGGNRESSKFRSVANRIKEIERHLQSISTREERGYYREDVAINLKALKRAPTTREMAGFLGSLVGRGPASSTISHHVWSANPYFSDSAVRQSEYDAQHRMVEAEISRRFAHRQGMLVSRFRAR
jgi:hypothetical protein